MAKRKPRFKAQKLEDRIAPGMVGAGLVDPGLAEVVDMDGGSLDSHSDPALETQVDVIEPSADMAPIQMPEVFQSNELSPDWMSSGPDGSLSIDLNHTFEDGGTLQDQVEVDADSNTLTMSTEFFSEQFSDMLPEGSQFQDDGTLYTPNGFNCPNNEIGLLDPANSNGPQISQDIAAVDGNGEVISANPTISTSTEKDMIPPDDLNKLLPDGLNMNAGGDIVMNLPGNAEISDGSINVPPSESIDLQKVANG